MALIDPKETRRVDIPHEPGEWVELRPITARDLANLQRAVIGVTLTQAENTTRILATCLTAWSYAFPITIENLERLDYQTHNWLDNELLLTSGHREDEEKKRLELPSLPTSDLERADSLVSSAT